MEPKRNIDMRLDYGVDRINCTLASCASCSDKDYPVGTALYRLSNCDEKSRTIHFTRAPSCDAAYGHITTKQ